MPRALTRQEQSTVSEKRISRSDHYWTFTEFPLTENLLYVEVNK